MCSLYFEMIVYKIASQKESNEAENYILTVGFLQDTDLKGISIHQQT